jgi:hypoxanthine-DNA glycosylase
MSDIAKSCFPPVVDQYTRLLILGSLPGDASLQAAQYYAHPRNQFWHLLGAVTGQDLAALPYAQRLLAMQAAGVGLWDVVAEARRKGSLDTDIRAASANDLAAMCGTLPGLRGIAFNGATAAGIGRRQLAGLADQLQLIDLPSSSPAHTMAYASKLAQWLPLADLLR